MKRGVMRSALNVIWYLVHAALAGGCVLVVLFGASRYGPADSPWFDLVSHFQWQYFLCATAALVAALICRMRLAAVTAIVALVFQSLAIAPLYFGGDRVDEEATMRVAVYNTWGGQSTNAETLQWIWDTNPDVIVFQEAMGRWPEFVKLLKEDYPHQHFAECETFAPLNALTISRLPIVEQEVFSLPPKDGPLLRTVVEVDGRRVAVYNVHLQISGSPHRPAQHDILFPVFQDEPYPYVIAGDFNATVWAPSQRMFAREAGVRIASDGTGVRPTWPVNANAVVWLFMRRRVPDLGRLNDLAKANRYFGIGIDHTYVSEGVSVVDFQQGPALGSDHLPHYTDLYVEPSIR